MGDRLKLTLIVLAALVGVRILFMMAGVTLVVPYLDPAIFAVGDLVAALFNALPHTTIWHWKM